MYCLNLMLVVFILAIAFVGCGNQAEELSVVRVIDLHRACAVWEKKKLANYDLVVRYEHGGMVPSASPVVIEVREGKEARIKTVQGDDRPTHFYSSIDSVDQILERIRLSLKDGVEVRAIFNHEFGFPSRLVGRFSKGSVHGYDLSIEELIPR